MKLSKLIAYAAGPVIGAIIGIILLPAMTWVYNPTDIGKFSLFQIFLSLNIIFISLGLDQSLIRFFHTNKSNDILMLCLVPSLLFFLVIFFLYFIFNEHILMFLFRIDDNSNTFLIIMSLILLGIVNRFLSVKVRMEEKAKSFSVNQILIKLSSLFYVLFVFFFISNPNFNDLLMGILISYLIALVFLIAFSFNLKDFAVNKNFKKEVVPLLSYGLPLIFSGILYWGFTSVNTFILSKNINFSDLSVYSIAISLAAIAILLQSVFSILWAPTIFKWYESGIENIKTEMNKISDLMLLLILFFFGFVGLFSPLIDFVLPDHYDSVKIILIICIVYPLLYIMSEINGIGISLVKKNKFNILINFISFIVNIVLALYFIPKYKITGAVIVGLVSYYFYFIIKSEISYKLWSVPGRSIRSYIIGAVISFSSVLSYFLYEEIGYYYIVFWIFYLICISSIFYKEIYSIVMIFFKRKIL